MTTSPAASRCWRTSTCRRYAARLLEMRPEHGRAGGDTELNQQQLENLRALGYVH